MKRILVNLGVIGLIILLAAVLGIAWLLIEHPTLDVGLNCPSSVTVGNAFDLVLETRNLHEDTIQLDSIDVQLEFLSGFEIVSIDPPPQDPVDIAGWRTWDFGYGVAPGGSLDVVFRLRAVKLGRYTGDIDVCNPTQDFARVTPAVDVLAR